MNYQLAVSGICTVYTLATSKQRPEIRLLMQANQQLADKLIIAYICFVSVHSGHGTSGQPTVINFSLLSKTCEEKGNTNINLNMYIFLRKIKCFMRGKTENVLDL